MSGEGGLGGGVLFWVVGLFDWRVIPSRIALSSILQLTFLWAAHILDMVVLSSALKVSVKVLLSCLLVMSTSRLKVVLVGCAAERVEVADW